MDEVLHLTMTQFSTSALMQPNIIVDTQMQNVNCSSLSVDVVYNSHSTLETFEMEFYNTQYCIFRANYTDNLLFKQAIDSVGELPAIINTDLGYVFQLGFFVRGLAKGMLVTQWLMSDSIVQTGKKSEPKVT